MRCGDRGQHRELLGDRTVDIEARSIGGFLGGREA
jgi:hypothetical protein